MSEPVFRLIIASSTALLGFGFVVLITAFFASSPVQTPVQSLLPDVEEAHALIIRRVISPEIQSELPLAPSGRVVFVSGHIHCTERERVLVEVDITQASTGSHAEGASQEPCTGEVQTWDAVAVVRGPEAVFEPEPAQACAVATTREDSQITDTFAWCKSVAFVEK